MEDDDCTSEFVRLDEIPDRTIGYNADPDILREFDVLDEFDEPQDDEDDGGISGDQNGDENNKRVKSSDKNDEDDGGDSSYTDDTDIPEDELEAMLEEGIQFSFYIWSIFSFLTNKIFIQFSQEKSYVVSSSPETNE